MHEVPDSYVLAVSMPNLEGPSDVAVEEREAGRIFGK